MTMNELNIKYAGLASVSMMIQKPENYILLDFVARYYKQTN